MISQSVRCDRLVLLFPRNVQAEISLVLRAWAIEKGRKTEKLRLESLGRVKRNG